MLFVYVIALIILFISLRDYIQRRNFEKLLAPITNVSKIPFIGNLLVMSGFHPDNLHVQFRKFVEKFGKSFFAIVFGGLVVVTANVPYVGSILSSQKHLHKHLIYSILGTWLGKGLLLSSGKKWQTMRKIITPTFHFKVLEEFFLIFDRQSSIFVQKLRTYADGQKCIDIYPFVELLTLDIIAEAAMSVKINAQEHDSSDFVQAVKNVTKIIATRFTNPFIIFTKPFMILQPKEYQKQIESIKIMHKFTEDVIRKRRASLESSLQEKNSLSSEDIDLGIKKHKALLDVLLEATIDGQPLTDEEIRDEVNTFMFAGHDTTSSAISFCLYLLSRNATCQQKLYKEIQDYFENDMHRPILFNDLSNLNYLNCVVKESLRLYPPIPAIGRYLKEDLQLTDAVLPSGSNAIILIWEILRDPTIYAQPELFWPERHLETNTNTFSYIPFSAGPRNCVGQRFALLEIKTVVVKIVRQYKLIEMGEAAQPTINIVLRSKTGLKMGLELRKH